MGTNVNANMRIASALFLLVSQAISHPTHHRGFDPTLYSSRGNTPPFQSYHVHVQYIKDGPVSNASAHAFRAAYAAHFNLTDIAACQGLFEQDRHCLYDVVIRDAGIFISGNWASYVPLEDYQEVAAWVAQHRKDQVSMGGVALDVLLHPNTNAYLHDHMRWSTWAGNPWPLNDEAFSDFGNYSTDIYC